MFRNIADKTVPQEPTNNIDYEIKIFSKQWCICFLGTRKMQKSIYTNIKQD